MQKDLPDIFKKKVFKSRYQLESWVREEFKEQQRHLRAYQKKSGSDFGAQLCGAYATRRTEAIIEYMDQIRQRFSAKHPDTSLEEDYVFAELHTLSNYDDLEDHYDISTAAAIWILDELKEEGKLEEAYRIMDDDITIFDVVMADVYDSIHPQQTICAMVHLIQTRNEALHRNDDECYVIDEGTARKQRADSDFRKIVALLDQSAIDHAVKLYEDAVWSWLGLFLEYNDYYSKQKASIARQIEQVKNKPKQSVSQFVQNSNQLMNWSPLMNPLWNAPNPIEQLMKLCEQYKDMMEQQRAFCVNIQMADNDSGMLERDSVPKIVNMKVGNPFAICFALFYLLGTGSNLPFLYFPGIAVIEKACRMLPWVSDADKVWNGEKREKDLLITYEEDIADDWYEKAQKLFDATGCLIPRDHGMYVWAERRVGKKLSPSAAILLDMRGMTKLDDLFFEAHMDRYEDEEEPEPSTDDLTKTQSNQTDDQQDQSAEIKKYREEIDRLKKQLYEANHQAQIERRMREANEEEQKSEHQELIDLRNYVFSLDQEEYLPAETDAAISLPYAVTHRIIVYGGHESWRKVIKDMVTNVRWIDKDETVRPDVIKNADVVFIQNNAMSHQMFYAIEGYCKKYKVRMRYCCGASAEKCALQIAEEDIQQQEAGNGRN